MLSTSLKKQFREELEQIIAYWKTYAVDEKNGGFAGQRDHYNRLVPGAPKGIILNTRILWTFSAVSRFYDTKTLKFYCDRAYDYIGRYFRDIHNGGVYWMVGTQGNPLNKRKQVYAQAFAVYALSEYALYSERDEPRQWALELFRLIETHSRDRERGGYIEAFAEDWSPLEDMRLSDKDENTAKTMNTHLHLLEAYTTLYRLSGEPEVKKSLEDLLKLFFDRFLGTDGHFVLFFDEDWNPEGAKVSFGHDIEAAWLLAEAAKVLEDEVWITATRKAALKVADTFLAEACDSNFGVNNEMDTHSGETDTDRHWWPHAEAMAGLYYACMISGDISYCRAMEKIWEYTRKYLIDRENGEWFFRTDHKGVPYTDENKIGPWKCPYHNSRAFIQLLTWSGNPPVRLQDV